MQGVIIDTVIDARGHISGETFLSLFDLKLWLVYRGRLRRMQTSSIIFKRAQRISMLVILVLHFLKNSHLTENSLS